jgi:DNA-binding Lrp family transcriptional regulator
VSTTEPPRGDSARRSALALDATDRALIGVLLRQARVSVRALAERLHISRASAHSRLGRLISERVITEFTVRIDPVRAGLGTSAIVAVSIEQNSWRRVSQQLREVPYVEHLALVGADFDVLATVRCPDNDALREIVLDRVHAIDGVRSTRTWLVFDEALGRGADWSGRGDG